MSTPGTQLCAGCGVVNECLCGVRIRRKSRDSKVHFDTSTTGDNMSWAQADESGMFSTHSSVAQLKPETVFRCVQEAEEQLWTQGNLPIFTGGLDTPPTSPPTLGSMLLSQSLSIKKIHNYFSQLEHRKCCLHLACKRSNFNSIRVLPSSRPRDDGSAKKNKLVADFSYLEPKEMRTFKHAYLCAVYPVLAAPEPPSSPASPASSSTTTTNTTTSSSSHNHNHPAHKKINNNNNNNNNNGAATSASEQHTAASLHSQHPSGCYSSTATSSTTTTTTNNNNNNNSHNNNHNSNKVSNVFSESQRSLSLNSLHDSGMEESEEAGLIPMESLCEQLRRSFALTHCVFQQYESIIIKTYSKKTSPQRVHPFTMLLAEELSGQLALLETNNNPFYGPSTFVTQNGYDLWQKQERINISKLLSKFWQSSLPSPKDTPDLVAHIDGVHDHYAILLKKLMHYERRCKQAEDVDNFTPLSSTSNRLLMEFSLRFGIGDVYRKIIFLECLTSEFSLSVGYLSLVNNLVHSIHHMLPGKKTAIVMVKREMEILQGSLRTLKVQTCKALSQMKRIFPGKKPTEGIELLMSLLKAVLHLMRYLAPAGVNVPQFESCLKMTIQSIFQSTYEMFKTVSRNDLEGAGRMGTDPRLLNILIQDIREDVTDYRSNFEVTFEKYFSISQMAATAYYQFLMDDVRVLTEAGLQHQPLVEIDLRMLALAYRLNQLDSDWKQYIDPQKQTWRAYFVSFLTQLTTALRLHLQNLVLETIANDKYTSQNLNLPLPFSAYQSVNSGSEQPSRSVSAKSITPSLNSAFSSIINSKARTSPSLPSNGPQVNNSAILMQESIPENENEQSPTNKGQNEIITPRRATVDVDSRSLNLNESAATRDAMRQSASRRRSLPEYLDSLSSDGFGDSTEMYNDNNKKVSKIKIKFNKAPTASTQSNNNTSEDNSMELPGSSHKRMQGNTGHSKNNSKHNSSENHNTFSNQNQNNCNNGLPSFRMITPPSDKICPNHESSYEEDYDDGPSGGTGTQYGFPPLKVQPRFLTSTDLARPVFTKPPTPPERNLNVTPTPQNKCRNFILRADAPASMSSRASSTLDTWDPYSYSMEHEFSDSLESNVSFPNPPLTQAMLPISGSTVDLLVILQRLCCFSATLVSTMITDSPFIVDNSSPTKLFPLTPHLPSVFMDNCNKNQPNHHHNHPHHHHHYPHQLQRQHSDSGVPPCTCSHSSQGNSSLVNRNYNRQSSVGSIRSERGDHSSRFATPQPGSSETSFVNERTDFTSLMADESRTDYPLFDGKKIKLSLHLRLLKATCNMIVVYTSNMLCMDLCGTPRNIAVRLVGPQLLELTESQQKGGLIWGCRHQAEDSHDCLFYLNRKTKYLCDRYEPVSQYMCTRINNTFACLQMLAEYRDNLATAMKIDPECKTPSTASSVDDVNCSLPSPPVIVKDVTDSILSEYVRVDQSGRLSEDTVSSSSLSSSLRSVDVTVLKEQHTSFVNQYMEAATQHSMAVLTAMCRLIAYKLNLFVRDGLPLLMHLKDSRVTMATALEPITSFLQKYLDSMSTWLYRSCFRRVLDSLWVLMVQDFETQAELLKKKGASAYAEAYNWMLAISHLIKFMNNNGRGIKKDLLLSQANDVIFRFHLFTLSTGHLITLYSNLKEYQYTEGDHLTLEENRQRSPPSILHRIHNELQSLRKCFSGAELVHWIMKNKDALPADLALPSGPVVRDTAITISQILLDQQFIVDIDSEMQTGNQSPLSFACSNEAASPYPQLSIHRQSLSSDFNKRSNNEGSETTSRNVAQMKVSNRFDDSQPSSSKESTPIIVDIHKVTETPVDGHDESSRDSTPVMRSDSESYPSSSDDNQPSEHRSHQLTSASEEFMREAIQHSIGRSTSRSHKDSFSSDIFNDSAQRQTPFSSLDSLYNNNVQRFVPSSKKFYLIHQSILNPGLTNHHHNNNHHHHHHHHHHHQVSGASRSNHTTNTGGTSTHEGGHRSTTTSSSHGIRGSRESLALVEQCVMHKISPMNVLTVIVARRKTDASAKHFMKKIPSAVKERALDILDEPYVVCRNS